RRTEASSWIHTGGILQATGIWGSRRKDSDVNIDYRRSHVATAPLADFRSPTPRPGRAADRADHTFATTADATRCCHCSGCGASPRPGGRAQAHSARGADLGGGPPAAPHV